MCGISFIFNSDGNKPAEQQVQAMVNALQHRGPDAQAIKIIGSAGLGHTRLSIVDLEAGAQPMISTDGRYVIVFNGEIYNFSELREQLIKQGSKFATHSDTEVILNLYARDGEKCVNQLRGMFSFAIHDSQDDTLFIARDRLGIKPLFYHWTGSTLVGASEIKAIFASGIVEPAFNLQSLRNYFSYQFDITPYTSFKDILQLPPGYTMKISSQGTPQLQQYWDLEFPLAGEEEQASEEQWAKKFADGLDDAAISHMIGDVPIGAYLSGGIDSSTTTYLLKQHYPQTVNTFTMRFLNPFSDESKISRNTAKHLGVPNHELEIDDKREGGYLDVLEHAIYHVEQPQRMLLDIPLFMLSDMVQQNNYKVVYTGDGADEIFGGYDAYRQNYIRLWGNQQKNMRQRRRYYLNEFKQNFSHDFLTQLWHQHSPKNQRRVTRRFGCYPVWNDFWHLLDDKQQGLFTDEFAEVTDHDHQMDELVEQMRPGIEGRDPLNQSLYIETRTRLPGWILWKTDRLCMSHGVEARVPFLDHPLVELTAQIPTNLKLNQMDEKYLLRKIMLPHMPEHPQTFKKRAFYTPIRQWLFAPENIEKTQCYLSSDAIADAGIFDTDSVTRVKDELLNTGYDLDMNGFYRVMQLEWVLTLVLSIQIMHFQFIKKNAPCFQ